MDQATIISIISGICIVTGLLFFTGAAVGLLRFSDFYMRMHAAGTGDTVSNLLVVLGFAIYQLHDVEFTLAGLAHDWVTILVILKLLGICGFIMVTSPTSTHALIDAGWEDGIEPELKNLRANALDSAEDEQSF